MGNPWVEFVRQYSKDNNISYGCAISEAGPAYRAMKAKNAKPKEKKSKAIVQKNDKMQSTKIKNLNEVIEKKKELFKRRKH